MRKLLITALSLTMVLAACTSESSPNSPNGDPNDPVNLSIDDIILQSRLVPFNSCADLLDHLKAEASERVGPYGLDGGGYWGPFFFDELAVDSAEDGFASGTTSAAATDDSAAVQSAQSDGGGDFTNTNVQELGVDEPDLIKTDGERILIASEGVLTYVDVSGDEPVVRGTLSIPEGWGHELFFQGDRALLFTNDGNWGYEPFLEDDLARDGDLSEPEYYGPSATIIQVDLSNPDELNVSATLKIRGQYLSARSVGTTVRLAVSSQPNQLPWVYPSSPAGEDRATRFNQELIDETTIEDWLPEYQLTVGGETTTAPLLECERTHRPVEFSGFDFVSVLSFDLENGLDAGSATGVLAGGQTVYASTDRFYVATTEWAGVDLLDDEEQIIGWSESYTTDIHAFAIDTDEPAQYVASGTVAGSLLNQFSMDEHDGYLRVITTDGSPWDDRNQSETQLVVMQESSEVLEQVGMVGGLGKGESLYSARLLDDVGFAVTFRQVDPFYVIDLSDPTNPTLAGELKIPGFSTYLHPIGEDRVLGIGQDATEEGQVTGFKVSLFNVSDPTNPLEVATWTVDNANSPAEYDHRAFQIIGSTAIIPLQSWQGDFNGAVLLEIGAETITEVGRVTHVPESTEPTSDCRPIEQSELSEDTELFWMAQEGLVQLCGEEDKGGYGDFYCDPIPLGEIRNWFGDSGAAEELLTELGAVDSDRIEICWPDGGNWDLQIQRSLVIDGTLWTMSWRQLQANALDGLNLESTINLR